MADKGKGQILVSVLKITDTKFDPAYRYFMIFACYFPKKQSVIFFFLRGGFSALEAQLEIVQAKFSQ